MIIYHNIDWEKKKILNVFSLWKGCDFSFLINLNTFYPRMLYDKFWMKFVYILPIFDFQHPDISLLSRWLGKTNLHRHDPRMLYDKWVENDPMYMGRRGLISSLYFCYFVIISPWKSVTAYYYNVKFPSTKNAFC